MAKFCKMCGQQMEDEDRFCDACGAEYMEESTGRAVEQNLVECEFERLEARIKLCNSKVELLEVKKEVEDKIGDEVDKKYLIQIITDTIEKINKKKKDETITRIKEHISKCDSIDAAVSIKSEIISSAISSKDVQILENELKEKIKEDVDNAKLLSDGIDPTEKLLGVVSAIMGGIAFLFCKWLNNIAASKALGTLSTLGIWVSVGWIVLSIWIYIRAAKAVKGASQKELEAVKNVEKLRNAGLYY